eukprot:evm.model.scf_159.2 EVM.evm.TU.scf_159.2   scf_159:22345-29222(-)
MDSDSDYDEEGEYGVYSDESDDPGAFGTEDEEEEAGYHFETDKEVISTLRKRNYKILEEDDLRARRGEVVNGVTSVLNVDDELAVKLLRLYKWDPAKATEAWFNSYEKVHSRLGLTEDNCAGASTSGRQTCLVCFEAHDCGNVCVAPCGHVLCKDCWRGFIAAAVEAGPSCLDLRCPQPDCRKNIPQHIISQTASEEDKKWIQAFDSRSFVDENPNLAWCTGPGCERIVESKIEEPNMPLDVHCMCGTSFCFTCREEAHRPVDCDTVKKWKVKNSAESENLNWILVNTKPCPECKRPIEKNQGCMHMTCSQCRHEFCWLCSAPWSTHNESTGGFYACNRYEVARERGDFDDETRKRDHARESLERYTHYYERWAAHELAHKKAKDDRNRVAVADEDSSVGKLSKISRIPEGQLKFILEAWNQVVECRRILKYSYAYGYYAFQDGDESKKSFFEFLQGDAEKSLENLHSMVEKKLKDVLDAEFSVDSFQEFRKNLIGLTDVTRTYFEKLVKQLEKGFEKIEQLYEAHGGFENSTSLDLLPSASSLAGSQASQASNVSQRDDSQRGAGTSAKGRGRLRIKRVKSAESSGQDEKQGQVESLDTNELEAMAGFWQCTQCTVANENLQASECEVCGAQRQGRTAS